MNYNTSTYVISLNYPSSLLKFLSDNRLEPILFKAINGSTLSQSIINKYFSTFYSYFGPKSSIGCALSHFKVWENFLKTDSKYAIIFEDDIISDVEDGGDVILKDKIDFYINQTPADFDILFLGSFGTESNFNFFTLMMYLLNNTQDNPVQNNYINKYIRNPSVILSTHAYVISRSGAEKLINNLKGNIHNHIDYCIQNLASKKLIKRYLATPRFIFQTSTDSTVSSNVSNSHPILFNKILENYYLDKHVKASYITTLSVFRLGNYNITISTLILIIMSILAIIYNIHIYYIILFLILISLPELSQFI